MDLIHRGTEWETREIHHRRKSPVVTFTQVHQGVRRWVCCQEMNEGSEKTHGRESGELLQPWRYHHPAIADTDAIDEDIEAT